MPWREDFQKFDAFFQQFERDLEKKKLSSGEEQSLVDNLNQVVEWGWKTLQHFDTESGNQERRSADENSFSGNHALQQLKSLFDKSVQIHSAHDVEYYRHNEWEIRAVIHPAFKELRNFFRELTSTEAAE